MQEAFPIVAGLLLGWSLASVTPRWQRVLGVVLVVLLGVTATVASGEWEVGWEFLLIDIPLVALCTLAGVVAARAVHRRRGGSSASA